MNSDIENYEIHLSEYTQLMEHIDSIRDRLKQNYWKEIPKNKLGHPFRGFQVLKECAVASPMNQFQKNIIEREISLLEKEVFHYADENDITA